MEHYAAALREPMAWFHLDSDFLDDPKIMRLGFEDGWAAIGIYVALMSRLAREDSHIFDVSTEYGWKVLQSRMALVGGEMDAEDLKAVVSKFAALGLIDSEMYAESGKIASDRLMREVENYADRTARKRCAGDTMREAKRRKGEERRMKESSGFT